MKKLCKELMSSVSLTGSASPGTPSRDWAFATVSTTFSRWFLTLSFCNVQHDKPSERNRKTKPKEKDKKITDKPRLCTAKEWQIKRSILYNELQTLRTNNDSKPN